ELAILHLNAGRLDAAIRLCTEVEARARRVGDETVMGRTLMYRGRAELLGGQLDAAVDCLHRARATLQRAGNLNAMLILGDLAVAALLAGDDDAAVARAEACDAELGPTSFQGEKPVAHLIRVAVGAERGAPDVEALLAEAEDWLVRPQASVDLAVIADRLAARLRAGGRGALAGRIARLAAAEWATIGEENPLRSSS
ncbi:MAG: hypothetical protein KC549_14725, partial [Myxococcales bacterium]|nr:hypothetical protein [Myxococcales bacterium]